VLVNNLLLHGPELFRIISTQIAPRYHHAIRNLQESRPSFNRSGFSSFAITGVSFFASRIIALRAHILSATHKTHRDIVRAVRRANRKSALSFAVSAGTRNFPPGKLIPLFRRARAVTTSQITLGCAPADAQLNQTVRKQNPVASLHSFVQRFKYSIHAG